MQEIRDLLFKGGILYLKSRFHAVVQVPYHPVCRGNVNFRVIVIVKIKYPGMLQVPVNDTDSADRCPEFTVSGNSAADAPDNELHLYSEMRRLVELIDQRPVYQAVQLNDNLGCLLSFGILYFLLYELQEGLPHIYRRQQQRLTFQQGLLVLLRPGQELENILGIPQHLFIAGQETGIHIYPGSALIQISRAQEPVI